MTQLDACAAFCQALSTTIGPTLTDIVLVGAASALVWWRGRVHTAKVVAPLVAQAAAAEAKADAAHAEVQSLRPPPPPINIAPSSSSSGNWAPVQWTPLDDSTPKPVPIDAPFPKPAPLPKPDGGP